MQKNVQFAKYGRKNIPKMAKLATNEEREKKKSWKQMGNNSETGNFSWGKIPED